MIMLNNYGSSELLVNRIKADENDKLLHVNRMNGKRVNGWGRVSESVTLTDASGNVRSWDSLEDGTYYTIKTEERGGSISATVVNEMRCFI